jgi:hypothetical protein
MKVIADYKASPEAIMSVRRVTRRLMQSFLSAHYAITISWPFRLPRFFISFGLFCSVVAQVSFSSEIAATPYRHGNAN